MAYPVVGFREMERLVVTGDEAVGFASFHWNSRLRGTDLIVERLSN
jgi:hypothetical protein